MDPQVTFRDLVDLASERLGGSVLYATDDYFAEKEFQADLDGLLKRLRAIDQSGASEVCIYLL